MARGQAILSRKRRGCVLSRDTGFEILPGTSLIGMRHQCLIPVEFDRTFRVDHDNWDNHWQKQKQSGWQLRQQPQLMRFRNAVQLRGSSCAAWVTCAKALHRTQRIAAPLQTHRSPTAWLTCCSQAVCTMKKDHQRRHPC